MSSNKRVKIFIKKHDNLLNFMWADVGADGSVMMGLYGPATFEASIEKIYNQDGELEPGAHFDTNEKDRQTKNSKISFHASGQYKLMSKIQKGSVDRATIKGIPLDKITKPIRMLEVLIPSSISIATATPKQGKDAIIDITKFPYKPLRCSVFCMPASEIDNFNKSKVIDTSIIEASCIFEYNNLIWTWTLRISKHDLQAHKNKFHFFVFGEIVWPN